MDNQRAMYFMMPALCYPNCAVRQARLAEMLQALLLTADGPQALLAEEIYDRWVEQDEEKRFTVRN